MNITKIHQLISKRGAELIEYSETELEPFDIVLINDEIKQYLMHCLTKEQYQASSMHMGGNLQEHIRANFDFAPGGYIFSYGFLGIAGDTGGNSICVDACTNAVYFAHHEMFSPDSVSYKGEDGCYHQLPGLTYNHILRGAIHLSDDFESFLVALLQDKLTEALDKLDK